MVIKRNASLVISIGSISPAFPQPKHYTFYYETQSENWIEYFITQKTKAKNNQANGKT